MDVSDIVNWGTLLSWAITLVLVIGRAIERRERGEPVMPELASKILSSNFLLGVIVSAALFGQGASMYLNYEVQHPRLLEDVTVSAYPEVGNQTLKLVRKQNFDNQNIPLDGYVFDRCTFDNVCLMYDGGAYELQHATFKNHWKVCVKDYRLRNYGSLLDALHLSNPYAKHTEKTVLKDFIK